MAKKKGLLTLGIVFLVAVGALGYYVLHELSNNFSSKEIVFTKEGNTNKYTLTGFGRPENLFTWTVAKEATVTIPAFKVPEGKGVLFTLDARPFLGGVLKKQTVSVYANDILLDKWTFEKSSVYSAKLPQEILNNGKPLKIKFIVDNPKSPKDLGLSSDPRNLGLGIKKLTLSLIDLNNPNGYKEYNIGQEISFWKNGNSSEYIGNGWSKPEKDFTWTDGDNAYVNLFVKNTAEKKLQLNVSGRCIFDSEEKYQKIIVYANNQELTTWECGRSDSSYHVVLPESVAKQGALEIKFHINKPIMVKTDPRHLGMSVKTMEIVDTSVSKTKIKLALWLKNKVFKAPETETTESAK